MCAPHSGPTPAASEPLGSVASAGHASDAAPSHNVISAVPRPPVKQKGGPIQRVSASISRRVKRGWRVAGPSSAARDCWTESTMQLSATHGEWACTERRTPRQQGRPRPSAEGSSCPAGSPLRRAESRASAIISDVSGRDLECQFQRRVGRKGCLVRARFGYAAGLGRGGGWVWRGTVLMRRSVFWLIVPVFLLAARR